MKSPTGNERWSHYSQLEGSGGKGSLVFRTNPSTIHDRLTGIKVTLREEVSANIDSDGYITPLSVMWPGEVGDIGYQGDAWAGRPQCAQVRGSPIQKVDDVLL